MTDAIHLNNVKKIHFIGVGGYGMSALAHVFLAKGYSVSGTDLKRNHIIDRLIKEGLIFFKGHNNNGVKELSPDLIVYSSAILDDNEELLYWKKKDIPVIKRGRLLGLLSKQYKTIAIAGTHGKTTTTSMIAYIFKKAKKSPMILVGGEMLDLNSNAYAGKSDWLITEADESDGSFLEIFPYISVITNIETDHVDYYKNISNIYESFQNFVKNTKKFVVYNVDDDGCNRISEYIKNGMRFGINNLKNNDIIVKNITFNELTSKFKIEYNNIEEEFFLNLPGFHNIKNALAAIIVSYLCGIELEKIKEYLKDFRGVARRLEIIWKGNGVYVFDDYAHHPTEIKASLSAIKEAFPDYKIISVFEPHRYSRLNYFLNEFVDSLMMSDFILCTSIYSAGEKNIFNLDESILLNNFKKRGINPYFIDSNNAIEDYFKHRDFFKHVILIMGAGRSTYIAKKIANILDKRYG